MRGATSRTRWDLVGVEEEVLVGVEVVRLSWIAISILHNKISLMATDRDRDRDDKQETTKTRRGEESNGEARRGDLPSPCRPWRWCCPSCRSRDIKSSRGGGNDKQHCLRSNAGVGQRGSKDANRNCCNLLLRDHLSSIRLHSTAHANCTLT